MRTTILCVVAGLVLVGCFEGGDESLTPDADTAADSGDSGTVDGASDVDVTDVNPADAVDAVDAVDTMDADTAVTDGDASDTDVAVPDGDASDTDVAVPDAPDTSDSDSASDVGPPATEKSVFVTSGTYDANLGGLAGADAKCQASADAVGLLGEYKAWLSDGTEDAATRLSHAAAPYRLVDGTQLASDWTGLTTAALSAPIDKDESGNAVAPTNMGSNCGDIDNSAVWTNSQEDGTTASPTYDCSDWTSTENTDTWTIVGSTKELSSWAYSCNSVDTCHLFARLFCFEQ